METEMITQYVALLNDEGTLSIYAIGDEIQEHQRFDVNVVKIVQCNSNCWLVLTANGDLEWYYLNDRSKLSYRPEVNVVDIAAILDWNRDPISNVLAIDDSGLMHHYILNLRSGPVQYGGQIILSVPAIHFMTNVLNVIFFDTDDGNISSLILRRDKFYLDADLRDVSLRKIEIGDGKIHTSDSSEEKMISSSNHYLIEVIPQSYPLVALNSAGEVLELSMTKYARLITSGVERLGYQLLSRTRIKSAISDD